MIARGAVLAAVLVVVIVIASGFLPSHKHTKHLLSQKSAPRVYMKWKREWITSTAYVVNPAEVGKSYNGIRCIVNGQETSTGTKPEVGTAAVDTKVFPYGTRFYFKGYGFAEARDTGVIGNVVDLVLPTCKKAILWGRRRRLAWVLLPHIR